MTPMTLELRACPAREAEQLVAGLGLRSAPLTADAWFDAYAILEDEALRSLLLHRIAICCDVPDPAVALLDRHTELIHATLDEAVGRLGAVPGLDGTQVRFSALGLPVALALPLDGWLAGADRASLHELARERAGEHLAPLVAGLRR